MKKNLLIIGASRGIGHELTKYFSQNSYNCIGVSRTEAQYCTWIEADISKPQGIEKVISELGNERLDAVLFSSGIWERYGFTDEFDFLKTHERETHDIFAVNVIAPIEITKGLIKNLTLASNPRAIYLGALSGTEGHASSQVAYTASKYALRGAIKSLSHALRIQGIGFTTVNPANVATEEVLEDIKEGRFTQQVPIPMSDIISSVEWILSLSNAVDVSEVNLVQRDSKG
jgi:short-subunit dehydrogenase